MTPQTIEIPLAKYQSLLDTQARWLALCAELQEYRPGLLDSRLSIPQSFLQHILRLELEIQAYASANNK